MKKLPLYPNGIRSPLDTHVPPPSGAKGCTACDMHTAGIVSPIPICVVQNKAFLRGEATEVSLVVFEAPTRGEASGSSAASSATHSTVLRVIAALDSNILLSAYALRCCPGNRPVEDTHIEACRGHLLDAVNSLSRGYTITRIYAVGAIAHRALLGRVVSAGMIPHAVSTIYPCFAPQGIPIISLPDAGVLRRNIPSAQNAVLNGLSAIHTSKVDLAQSLTAPKDRNTHLVQSVEDHKSAFATIKKLAHVVFDTETVGRLHTPLFRVVSITFGGVTGASITYDGDLLEDHTVLNDFREFFTTSTAVKIGHNIKYDLLAIWCWLGVRVIGPVIDTRLDHKLISSTSAGDLATCAEMVGFGGHKNEARAAVDLVKRDLVALANADMRSPLKSGKPRKPPTLHYLTAAEVDPAHLAEIRDGADTEAFAQAYIDPRVRARYNALDVHATAALHRLNEQRLVAGRLAVAEEVVRPAILALTEMEATGLRVDVGALDIFTTYLESEIAVVQQRLAKYPGVNFSSPKQLAELLYDKLGLPVLAETPTGGRATGEEVLLALAEKTKHPLPKDVLAFRELEKLHGTYAEGMKKHIRYGDRGPRIHPSTLLDGAGTGRLSSQNPNMQNVPSPDRDKPGRPAFGKMARDIFIADPGCVLLEVDMSQQELRIAGMLSGDPVILECYQRGEDIHRATAAVVYGVAPEAVSKEQRSRSKTVTFGLLYGKTDRGLSKQLNITVDEARHIRQAVLGRFKHLAKWCEDMLSQARRDGGVFTWWNGHAMARWRELPAINDQTEEGFGARINAENAAVNTPIQGLAADIVTASLYPIVHRFHKEGVNAQLVNTVHDSVMVNVALEDLPRAARIMREVMTGHNTMGFPLAVDMKSGPRWGSMSEYHPPE